MVVLQHPAGWCPAAGQKPVSQKARGCGVFKVQSPWRLRGCSHPKAAFLLRQRLETTWRPNDRGTSAAAVYPPANRNTI